jgi:hypothetical protein
MTALLDDDPSKWHKLGPTRLRWLEKTDAMPAELRHCVHDFGYLVVSAFINAGVTDAGSIRTIVYAVWRGSAAPGQGKPVWQSIDHVLSNQLLDHKGLCRMLASSGFSIVSHDPTKEMVAASMAEVSGGNVVVPKEEKHRRRLRAALKAAGERFEKEAAS